MGEFKSNLGISKGGSRQTYSISTAGSWQGGPNVLAPKGFDSVAIEDITRAGLPEDVLKRLRAKRPPVDMSGDADFRFGKPSKFALTDPEQPTQPGVVVNNPGGEEEPEEPPPGALIRQFDFVSRTAETIRVENPDDPEDYVMVERDTSVLFRNRDTGEYVQFNIGYD